MAESDSERLVPLQSEAVFSVSATSIINAPRDHVWKVLTDFEAYREWNPFVRAQNVADASRNPLPDSSLAAGLFLNISEVHIPPTLDTPTTLLGKSSSFERINTCDRENYRLSWEIWGAVPTWVLYAERWQILTDEGNGTTKYYTLEVFKGAFAYVVKALLKKGLEEGFQAMADTLKERAEQIIAS